MNGRLNGFWDWKWVVLGLVGVLPLGLNSCTQVAMPPAPAVEAEQVADAAHLSSGAGDVRGAPTEVHRSYSKPVDQRPGLGTGWGGQMRSEMGYTGFARGSSKPYGGVAMIYYNDKEGVEAMTSWKFSGKGMQTAAGGLVEWGVKGRFGFLKNYHSGSRRFVVGRDGSRYSLLVKNLAKSRLEVVLSVDGLDVMDGKEAHTRKRGYIIRPGQTLEVKGWRTSTSSVASFEFASVSNSYANLGSGDPRNVGVIGMAVFTEKGVDPFSWMPREVRKRETASPFADPPMRQAR